MALTAMFSDPSKFRRWCARSKVFSKTTCSLQKHQIGAIMNDLQLSHCIEEVQDTSYRPVKGIHSVTILCR